MVSASSPLWFFHFPLKKQKRLQGEHGSQTSKLEGSRQVICFHLLIEAAWKPSPSITQLSYSPELTCCLFPTAPRASCSQLSQWA